ncbi:small nuclear ribonucleoprotein-associated protein B-like [Tigriopus californicus]|nr:small nuclear ribonucleoprotein-associated protein B-like [Tigriopus californicus]
MTVEGLHPPTKGCPVCPFRGRVDLAWSAAGRGVPMGAGGAAPGLSGPVRGVGGPAPSMMAPGVCGECPASDAGPPPAGRGGPPGGFGRGGGPPSALAVDFRIILTDDLQPV